jgi:UV DNA damage endonuclease
MDARPQDHAEYVANVPEWLCRESDVMIESHGKEQSLLCVREAHTDCCHCFTSTTARQRAIRH